ncbi:MAG: hypothetical protein ACYDCK_07275 [Thermoplasmatota archaeon]
MRRPREDHGSMQVLEAILIGTLMLGSVLFVTNYSAPAPSTQAAHDRLQQSACDALNVLGELPATQTGYASMLEQVVTESLKGDTTNLTTRLSNYFAPGTRYQMYLNNGQGDYSIYQNADTSGEATTCTKLLDPHWSYEIVYPDIAYISGVETCTVLNVCTPSLLANFYAVPIRDSYLDWSAAANQSGLFMQNLFAVQMTRLPNGLLQSLPNTGLPTQIGVNPEYVDYAGVHHAGFSVPYTTTAGAPVTAYGAYTASIAGTGPTQYAYGATNNLSYPVRLPLGAAYFVNPVNTVSSALVTALRASGGTNNHFTTQGGKTEYTSDQTVTFNWNYNGFLGAGQSMQSRAFRVWAPFGAITTYSQQNSPQQSESFNITIPHNALWGTYVADLQFNMTTPGLPTQVIHEVLPFTVRPPSLYSGVMMMAPTPPVYRVELVAWYGDWK